MHIVSHDVRAYDCNPQPVRTRERFSNEQLRQNGCAISQYSGHFDILMDSACVPSLASHFFSLHAVQAKRTVFCR